MQDAIVIFYHNPHGTGFFLKHTHDDAFENVIASFFDDFIPDVHVSIIERTWQAVNRKSISIRELRVIFYMKSGIYLLKNKINGKVYIGQATDLHRRKSSYQYPSVHARQRRPIIHAIKKYGWNNFNFSILEACPLTELNAKEIHWINQYQSTNREKGYNISAGGNVFQNIYAGENNPFFGQHHSEETKSVLSLKAKIRFQDKDNHPFTGKKHTQSTIEKFKKINRDYSKIPILQLDKETRSIIRRWDSARDAAITLFGDYKKSNGICVACRQYASPTARKTAFGFRWIYEKPSNACALEGITESEGIKKLT